MSKAVEKRVTNPHGANQWYADPRQQHFLAYYFDPKSPTFGNARQSALKAGFEESYADNILNNQPAWLLEKLGQISPLLLKAERNIAEFLELPNETQAMGMYGPIFERIEKKQQVGKYKNGKPKFKKVIIKKPVTVLNSKIMKIKQDSSHFVAETVGRVKYSKKDSGEGGVQNNIFIFANEQRNKIAARIIRGGSISNTPSPRKAD